MLTAEQLRNTQMVVLPTGEVLGTQDGFATFQTIFTPNTVRSEYANLLAASSLLYNCNVDITTGLEALVEALEETGANHVAASVVGWISAMKVAQASAIEGLPSLAARTNAPSKKDAGDAK